MEWFFKPLYNVFIYPIVIAGAKIVSLRHKKIRRGFELHKHAEEQWKEKAAALKPGIPRVWFHATSTGEFEQARPVIERLREQMGTGVQIILTYYSPTVEKCVDEYSTPDICEILPLDFTGRVCKILELISPTMLVFVKFDTWPNIIWQAHRMGIRLFLIDATLRKKSMRFFSFIGRAFSRSVYGRFSYIGAVSEADSNRFRQLVPPENVHTAGDTRFDQVLNRKKLSDELRIPTVLQKLTMPVFICGSTWEGDESRLIPAVRKLLDKGHRFHTVIVPHEPEKNRIEYITGLLKKHNLEWCLYSQLENGSSDLKQITVLDAVGFLAEFYRIGTFCYVGGAFLVSGVHNCMEPGIMGMPLFFGPNYHNAPEAEELVRIGGAYEISSSDDIVQIVENWLNNPQKLKGEGQAVKLYIEQSLGASEKYAQEIVNTINTAHEIS